MTQVESERPPTIPERWACAPLGDVAHVTGGVTKDAKRQGDPAFVEVPYLRVANVQRGYLNLRQITTIRVPADTAEKLRLEPGDVLFNEGGDRDKLGRGWVWGGQVEGCIHQNHVFRARLAPGIDPRLVSWWGNSFGQSWFQQRGRQTTNLASMNLSTLKALPVPIPSPGEQASIVAAIEEAFSLLDAGEAGLHATRTRLKRMRDSVLTAAVTGRLVPQDQCGGQTLPPAGGDGDRLPGLPRAWTWTQLGDLATEVRNGVFASRPAAEPPGIRILRIGAVRPMALDLADVRYADLDPADGNVQRALLRHGDLLFTRYNGNPEYVGACAAVPARVGDLLHPDKLIRVRVDHSLAVPQYISIAASAGASLAFVRSATKTTAGQAGISGSDLKRMPIPLPPVQEQSRIVAEVERQFSFIKAAEQAVADNLKRSSALRRSVLQAAFEGRLVPQDPLDEPASLTLERIGRQSKGRFARAISPGS